MQHVLREFIKNKFHKFMVFKTITKRGNENEKTNFCLKLFMYFIKSFIL